MIPLVIEQKMDAICKENEELKRDVNRLNNIINELEKLLEQMILDTKTPTVLNNSEKMAIRIAIQHIQDKLKELKEGNNENNNKENN